MVASVKRPERQCFGTAAHSKPFEQCEFRGCFKPESLLWESLNENVRHGCHHKELARIIRRKELHLRSTFDYMGRRLLRDAPCAWLTLNKYVARGNFYGPYAVEQPVSTIGNRGFMVFERLYDRPRYYFVEFDGEPLYSKDHRGLEWDWIKPDRYFGKVNGRYYLQSSAIYEFVLTTPLELDRYSVDLEDHPQCVPGKCSGNNRKADRLKLIETIQAGLETRRTPRARRAFAKRFGYVGACRTIREAVRAK